MNVQQTIDRNREAMRLFEKCINTNDLELGRKLIAETAAFKTPVSPTPLYGAEGYLGVAIVSCNDGLRPVIMKLEATDEESKIDYEPVER